MRFFTSLVIASLVKTKQYRSPAMRIMLYLSIDIDFSRVSRKFSRAGKKIKGVSRVPRISRVAGHHDSCCLWSDAWNRQLVCIEFFSCNAGLLWLVAADRIGSYYFRALLTKSPCWFSKTKEKWRKWKNNKHFQTTKWLLVRTW